MAGDVDDIDALSENDIWLATGEGAVLRGDGKDWRRVQTLKSTDGKQIALVEIDVRTVGDAWAIGRYREYEDGPWHDLLFHWDGTGFEEVPVPDSTGAYFSAIDAVAENDAWLVGYRQEPSPRIWHWDGKVMTPVPVPDLPGDFGLYDVAAVSADDVWAVGSTSSANLSLAIHWDGKQWSTKTGTKESLPITAHNIVITGYNDLWAVGSGGSTIIRWDVSDWESITMPSFESYNDVALYNIDATSSNDVWVVGSDWTHGPRPFAAHWDGAKWSVVPSPNLLNMGYFQGVKAFGDRLWVIGRVHQDEDLGPTYPITAEFKREACSDSTPTK